MMVRIMMVMVVIICNSYDNVINSDNANNTNYN